MLEILTIGELLVEIMRPGAEMPLGEPGEFLGPFPSGAPAIFADAAARLGHSVGIIGGVGDDDFGRCVLGRLAKDGVMCDLVRVAPGRSTATAFIAYFRDGSRKYLFHLNGTAASLRRGDMPRELPAAGILHLMGCSMLIDGEFTSAILDAAERLGRRGTRISFDPNMRVELLGAKDMGRVIEPLLAHCSIFLPGAKELLTLAGADTEERAVEKLLDRYPMEIVAVKKGRDGCTIHTRQAKVNVLAYPVEEVDPTGAGDCFDAGFLCGVLEGEPLATCARMGAAAGALNASAFGPMEGALSRAAVRAMIGAVTGG